MSDTSPIPPADDTASLQTQLDAALGEIVRLKDLAGRAQADVQNAKQRMEREAADLRSFAAESVIRRILPTLDNFQRAFGAVPADIASHEWVKGLTAIEQDLLKQVSDMGLSRMQSLGAAVDPAVHEVITIGPGDEGTVIEVFEEGYMLNGKVIRPAKVRAGSGDKSSQ